MCWNVVKKKSCDFTRNWRWLQTKVRLALPQKVTRLIRVQLDQTICCALVWLLASYLQASMAQCRAFIWMLLLWSKTIDPILTVGRLHNIPWLSNFLLVFANSKDVRMRPLAITRCKSTSSKVPVTVYSSTLHTKLDLISYSRSMLSLECSKMNQA